jgi:hypothetical protein
MAVERRQERDVELAREMTERVQRTREAAMIANEAERIRSQQDHGLRINPEMIVQQEEQQREIAMKEPNRADFIRKERTVRTRDQSRSEHSSIECRTNATSESRSK